MLSSLLKRKIDFVFHFWVYGSKLWAHENVGGFIAMMPRYGKGTI